jgi:hypothetical protein
VESADDTEASGEPLEPMGDAVRVDRRRPVGEVGEHVGVGRQGGPTGEGVLGLGDPASAQQLDRSDADGDPALGVGLGRLGQQGLAAKPAMAPAISTSPWSRSTSDQRTAHSSPRRSPAHYRQAQEQAELRVLDCGGRQQPGDVLDRRRLGVDSGR